MRGREVPARRPSVQREGNLSLSAIVKCEHPAASRSSAAGSLPLRKPGSRRSRLPRLLRSRSSVRLRRGYTWALFLQTSAGVNPAGSLPGAQDAAVPAAGADSVGTSPPQTAPERCTKASPRADYPDSDSEPSRLRPVRPSALPHRRSLPRLQGAQGLPSATLQSPPPLAARPPPRPASASLRLLGHWQTRSRRPQAPTPIRRLRDCQQPRPTGPLTPERQRQCGRRTPPGPQQKSIYI